ncbi:MAG TPA: hypothetical protein VFK13_10815 [Gemmatimonadaceae bacterium]|nr:hypothetical protein [Gemmatimonadaceae bacterium]
MRLSLAIAAALVMIPAARGAAQVTGSVRPPRQPVDSSAAALAAIPDTGRVRDSIIASHLKNMQEWVDSAAVAVSENTRATRDTIALDTTALDTVAVASGVEQLPPPEPRVRTSERRSPRAVAAPDTATQLPLVVLAGALLLVAGWLLRRAALRPARAPAIEHGASHRESNGR